MPTRRRTINPEAKRAAIMSAGERLFARQGYAGTTMAEVARVADVAVGTVYRLFPDKQKLLAALHRDMEDRFIAAMVDGWSSEPDIRRRFRPMVEALFAMADGVRETFPLYAMTGDLVGPGETAPGAQMVVAIGDLYETGIAAEAFRPIEKDLVGPMARGLVEGAMLAWMTNPSPDWRSRVIDGVVETMERAFLTGGEAA